MARTHEHLEATGQRPPGAETLRYAVLQRTKTIDGSKDGEWSSSQVESHTVVVDDAVWTPLVDEPLPVPVDGDEDEFDVDEDEYPVAAGYRVDRELRGAILVKRSKHGALIHVNRVPTEVYKALVVEDDPDDADGVQSKYLTDHEVLQIHARDSDLTPRQAEAWYFNKILDLSREEAGNVLGISASTVKEHVARARSKVDTADERIRDHKQEIEKARATKRFFAEYS